MPHTPLLPDSIDGFRDPPPSRFVCSWTNDDLNVAWVHLAGELDLATTPQLERALGEPQSRARLVVLDLRELKFIASSGVHAILNASNRARRVGRRIVLLRGHPNVDRVFTLTGSSDDLEIRDIDPALAPFQVLPHLAEQNFAV